MGKCLAAFLMKNGGFWAKNPIYWRRKKKEKSYSVCPFLPKRYEAMAMSIFIPTIFLSFIFEIINHRTSRNFVTQDLNRIGGILFVFRLSTQILVPPSTAKKKKKIPMLLRVHRCRHAAYRNESFGSHALLIHSNIKHCTIVWQRITGFSRITFYVRSSYRVYRPST